MKQAFRAAVTLLAIGSLSLTALAAPPADGPKPGDKARRPGALGGLQAQGGELKKKLLDKFDKNGDGKLDADEMKAAREEMTKNGGPADEARKKLVEKFDKNGDGKLDADEMKAAREEMTKNLGNRLPGSKKPAKPAEKT